MNFLALRLIGGVLFVPFLLCGSQVTQCRGAQDADSDLAKKEVNEAVRRGIKWLQSHELTVPNCERLQELALLALLVAGTPDDDPLLKEISKRVDSAPYDWPFRVGLRACVYALRLQKDPRDAESFARLAACAKALTDFQTPNGHWGAGAQSPEYTKRLSSFARDLLKKIEASRAHPERSKGSEAAAFEIRADPVHTAKDSYWDHFETQFALLGLLAASTARLELAQNLTARLSLSRETLPQALAALLKSQRGDGGWGFGSSDGRDLPSYLSATYGGLASLLAIRRIGTGLAVKSKPILGPDHIKRIEGATFLATEWIRGKYSVKANAGFKDGHVIYGQTSRDALSDSMLLFLTLFSMEGVGSLLETETIAGKKWYADAATHLLALQREDGGWPPEQAPFPFVLFEFRAAKMAPEVASTSLAILLLTRATARVVPPAPSQKR